MSRTYRAQSGDRWWRNDDGSNWAYDGWKGEHFAKYWESDNPHRWGVVKTATKQQHREVSRADTRHQLGTIKKDVDHDFYNREGLYKGFCWNWD